MEGPTPVSALIHAATMVTAGIFLLLRTVHLLKYDEKSLLLISFLGGITAFIAATIGLFQNDIKKIIAYSTCSQLGYMTLSCGLNNYSGSLFHLMNHAFFKALLFLSAGAIIHSMLDQQDIRRMGMLLKYLPISHLMILVGSLTIMGVPFLTGFYSKDFILEYVYSSNILLNFFLYSLSILSACLTSFYSIKLLFLVFYNIHNSYEKVLYDKIKKLISVHESNILILIALIVLFFGSIFIGFLFKDLFIGMGTDI
jgi:NADH-ubiquinone oxidoreductase chain 5